MFQVYRGTSQKGFRLGVVKGARKCGQVKDYGRRAGRGRKYWKLDYLKANDI
jgi:hypothetical protein